MDGREASIRNVASVLVPHPAPSLTSPEEEKEEEEDFLPRPPWTHPSDWIRTSRFAKNTSALANHGVG
jgi:hypothetical protein